MKVSRRDCLQAVLGFALLPSSLLLPSLQTLKRFGERSGSFTIAFGSCNRQELPQFQWDRIQRHDPDLFLFLGDNVYADTYEPNELRAAYEKLGNSREYSRFRDRVPVLATWDDHDYGFNDVGREYPLKEVSKKIFLEFFREPANSLRRQRPGIYTSYYFGETPKRVQLILLDLRWFRSPLVEGEGYIPSDDPNAELLGSEQWNWLEEELQQPAEVRIIGSSVQMVPEDHHWERWSNFPYERARFYSLIDRLNIRNLFVLSGDMHFGELSMGETPRGIPMVDFTSSGLNFPEEAVDITNRSRLEFSDKCANYGLVHISWETQIRVRMELHRSENGERIFHREFTLGQNAGFALAR